MFVVRLNSSKNTNRLFEANIIFYDDPVGFY